ncbi:hypothetical protein [Pluralibacter gergoviae]|uniref:hypothetical protein n=1 Tax=Pluralibacter gergoviae TaxID=61647 RepID=UPI000A69F969|nr:hypothetical protein [Pluralibacter gergoviae]
MKVAIEVNGEVIWYRDSDKQEGMASLGYLQDGTQQKIIAALEDALKQAQVENIIWDEEQTQKDIEAAKAEKRPYSHLKTRIHNGRIVREFMFEDFSRDRPGN